MPNPPQVPNETAYTDQYDDTTTKVSNDIIAEDDDKSVATSFTG